ncbi:MAG: efflux RND transporter periplasmic adaptor subunit [Bacteroidota bacterium]
MKLKIILPILVVLFVFVACGRKKQTVMPTNKDITESVYATGIIKSKDQYEVFSKTVGILKKKFVKEGDHVKKGDKLFEIDNANSRLFTDNARVAAATADYATNLDKLNDAKNLIDLAKKKLKTDSLLYIRQKNLWDSNIGSKIDLEQRELNYENSKTAVASAQVHCDDLKRQLRLSSNQSKNNLQMAVTNEEDLIIKSDVDGVVYQINKELGELVTSLVPISVVGAEKEFIVELAVDEYDIAKMRLGQKVLIRMDSYKNQVFEGSVSKIDPMMNDRTRTFKAEAIFVRKPDVLYPNLTAETNVVINAKQNVLTIPRNCLVNDSTVMLDNGDLQKVQTGLMDYTLVEILNGITSATKLMVPQK